MKKEYISAEQFTSVLTDIHQKIEMGEISECNMMLKRILDEARSNKSRIDRDYIDNIREKRRNSRIEDIRRMLEEMTLEQIENVHKYTSDERDEPNHEAEALNAVIDLSRRKNQRSSEYDSE